MSITSLRLLRRGVTMKVAELGAMSRSRLIQAWETSFGSSPPPSTSQDMMRLIIGWELQAKSARSDVRALKAAVSKLMSAERNCGADPITKPKLALSAGTRLSRDWQGGTYCVDVLDKGYAYEGKLYSSRSAMRSFTSRKLRLNLKYIQTARLIISEWKRCWT